MAMIFLGLFQGSIANAVSVYDDTYNTNPSVQAAGDSCTPINLTSIYSSYILDSSKWFLPSSTMQPIKDSYEDALTQGRIGVSMRKNYRQQQNGTVIYQVYVYWNTNNTLSLQWSTESQGKKSIHALVDNYVSIMCLGNYAGGAGKIGVGDYYMANGGSMRAVPVSNNLPDIFSPYAAIDRNLFVDASAINYPSEYEGEQVHTSDTWADLDGDGLIASQETTQGTSNANNDTDGDGLDDYIESQWNPDRDSVFCGTQCAYPAPTTEDIYVEIDWMNNPNDNSYQPSSTQLNQVKSAFNTRGINVHFDTGQYGGGNELLSYENILPFAQDANNFDFYDYKNGTSTTNANFDSDRKRIWHYMISGYQYAESTGSSGVSYAGDDDFFVSYGLIKDSQSSFGYTNLDTAIAGTIIHELGHNLCLGGASSYSGQAEECVYGGIDNVNASSDYESSMNYSYQMFMVDYSTGVNGAPNDHDDWHAVDIGIGDFSNSGRDAGDIASGKGSMKNKSDKELIQGISVEQAQELRKKNTLGKRNVNYFTHHQMLMR